MVIEKEVLTKVNATNGVSILENDIVAYVTKGDMFAVGIYRGLTKRGSLIIESPIDKTVSKNVLANAIESIYVLSEFGIKEN